MTKQIWKYQLDVKDEQIITTKLGAEILCVQVQDEIPCIWALVDPSQPPDRRLFHVYGTGHPMDETGSYIGTFQLHGGSLVFHLFEELL